jgi:hypothetical protein
LDEFADAAGGDRSAAYDSGCIYDYVEAELLAQGFEAGWTGDARLGLVAEAKVFALVDLGGVNCFDQDLGGEIPRMHVTHLVAEGKDQGAVDAGGGE